VTKILGLAGCFTRNFLHSPLERLKIIQQTQDMMHGANSEHKVQATVWRGLKQMYARDGVRGLFQGNLANCVRVAPYAALQFWAFERFSEAYINMTPRDGNRLTPFERLWIGGSAGVVAVTCTYPLDYVRGRLSVQGSGTGAQYKGIVDALATIIRADGVKGVYRGLSTTAIGIGPYLGVNFATYNTLREHFCGDDRPSVFMSIVLGGTAGAFAQTAGYPFDSVRRRIQVDGFAKGSKRNPALDSIFSAFRFVVQTEGVRGLYKGYFANLSKVVPTLAVHWAVYEAMRDALGLPSKAK